MAVTDDKIGLSEAVGLSTMSIVNLIGTAATAPGFDSLDTRENGVGLEGGLSPVQKRWVNIRKGSSLKRTHLGNRVTDNLLLRAHAGS